ncbi:MAG: DUF1501 domain-containing protein [Verrucomicrobiales bacterium]|nr:DUF1501 domain-containing protein [Verrucomicrobiales bacterium]
MMPFRDALLLSRRRFLTSAASGLGAVALSSLLKQDSLGAAAEPSNALSPKPPHRPARARNCIFIFLAGGTSQIELFDPKPELIERTGQKLPDSFFKNERFSFIKPDQSLVMGSQFKFRRYGQCGMELSELLPSVGSCADEITLIRSMYTDQFDHAPAEIMFSTGTETPGRPSAGAWVLYGLGSESSNLPGYVVLMTGRGPVSRSSTWGSGFLSTNYAGVLFNNQGEPVLNLANPPGVTPEMQRAQIETVAQINRQRYEKMLDPEIASRIAAYELAFRMQTAAPELIDLRGERPQTHAAYGTERSGEAGSFSQNCLLARRLVERGVRFVSIFHRRWDQHSRLKADLDENCRVVDQPIGALVQDLKQRGLLDSTLVVWGTEFGRTPVTQNKAPGPDAGRDHHRFGFSLWLAGGGVKGGQVIGKTDDFGWHAIEDRVHVHDFHATLLHLFGLEHLKLTYQFKGLDVRLTNQGGNVVEKVYA